MKNEQRISCPNCQTEIIFDTYALLQGVKFMCTNCQAKIGLSSESKDLVEDTMVKFDEMKKQILSDKK